MIYISSQGGCKGDMCPKKQQLKVKQLFFLFFYDRGRGRRNANAHTRGRSLLVSLQDIQLLRTLSTHSFSGGMWRGRIFHKTKRTAWSISYPAPDWPRSPDEAFHNPLIHFAVALFSGNQWSLSSTGRALFSLFFSAWFGNFFLCNVVPAIDHVVNHRSCQTSNDRLWGNKKRTRGALMAGYFYHWLTCALLSNSLKKWNMPQHNLSQLKRFKMLAFNNHLSKTQRYIQFTFVDVVRATTHI